MSVADDWPAAADLGRGEYPSLLYFNPTASGRQAVRRVLQRLLRGEYTLVDQVELWANGDTSGAGTVHWPWHAHGHLYFSLFSDPLHRWCERRAVDLQRLRLVLTLRDPRDSVISLYHLSTDPTHSAPVAGSPVATTYEAQMRRVRSQTLEEYVAANFQHQLHTLTRIRQLAEQLPPENVYCLSYAQLCHDFPTFLRRLIDLLQIEPDPAAVEEVLNTEDVRHKDRLTTRSLSHCTNAAPMPGRHKRELQPDTIARITEQSRDILHWLASMDAPELATIYLDGVTP